MGKIIEFEDGAMYQYIDIGNDCQILRCEIRDGRARMIHLNPLYPSKDGPIVYGRFVIMGFSASFIRRWKKLSNAEVKGHEFGLL